MRNPLPRREARSREEVEDLARDGAKRLTRGLERSLTEEAERSGLQAKGAQRSEDFFTVTSIAFCHF